MRETVHSIAWLIASVTLTIVIKWFVDSWVLSIIAIAPLSLMFLLMQVPRLSAYVLAHRSRFVLALATVVICIALVIQARAIGLNELSLSSLRMFFDTLSAIPLNSLMLGFLLLGTILGALFRQAIGRAMATSLLHPRLTHKITSLCIWCLILVILPLEVHSNAQFPYLLGVSLGIPIHKAAHLWMQRKIQSFKRISNVYAAVPDQGIGKKELFALNCLRFHQFWLLRRTLTKWKSDKPKAWTKSLALISASLFRIKGRHLESNREIEDVLSRGGANAPEDTHLRLLMAINLRDLGQDINATAIVNELLKTREGRSCPLVHATKVLMLAEDQLRNLEKPTSSIRPLIHAYRSLEYRHVLIDLRRRVKNQIELQLPQALQNFMSWFMDYSIPTGVPLLLDMVAYANLAAGYHFQAGVLLQRCLDMDPSYSSTYLHLGEWHQMRMYSHANTATKSQCEVQARLCYHVARFLEPNASTMIYKTATQRLKSLP